MTRVSFLAGAQIFLFASISSHEAVYPRDKAARE